MPTIVSPSFFFDYSTRHNAHRFSPSAYLVVTSDCLLLDISKASHDTSLLTYGGTLACTPDYDGTAISSSLPFCFYDVYQQPASSVCRDYRPVIAFEGDATGIQVSPKLTGLTAYTAEWWMLVEGEGSMQEFLTSSGNPLYEMKVASLNSQTQVAQVVFSSGNIGDMWSMSQIDWYHIAAVFEESSATI